MTTVDDALTSADDDRAARAPADHWFGAVDRCLEWTGEYLNPILVKETRQALKSRQFVITFTLLLGCVWVWSIYGVAWLGLTPSYSTGGPDLFLGYFVILAFPLLVVVPFGAFRSLASEREDRTYELLSITTLRPRQIIGGKLGSAVIQMIVFLSAVAPCLAFTYLLRGIDILTIVMMIGYICFASLAFSLVGLLIATLAVERYIQSILSVALVIGQFWAFVLCVSVATAILQSAWPFQQWQFWTANAVGATIYVGYFALFYLAAAAQLSFASENRSTPLRIVMVLQFAAFIGWMSTLLTFGPTTAANYAEFGMALVTVAGIHWAVMGMFMVGESPKLSPRVRRGLPKTFLGRALFTWLAPGPGTGYVLAISGTVAAAMFAAFGLLVFGVIHGHINLVGLGLGGGRRLLYARAFSQLAVFSTVFTLYVTIYLGLGKLLVARLRKWSPDGLILPLLCTVLLVLVGTGLPYVILMSTVEYPRYDEYMLLHVTNPFWTLYELAWSRGVFGFTEMLLMILIPSAVLVFFLNLRSIFDEIAMIRVQKPLRVLEDDRRYEKDSHSSGV